MKNPPYWYVQDDDTRMINASVEPSGLQFYAEMQQEEGFEFHNL